MSETPLISRVRSYLEELDSPFSPGTHLVTIFYAKAGGEQTARKLARSLQMALASLRRSERLAADARCKAAGDLPIMVTYGEDVFSVMNKKEDRVELTFYRATGLNDLLDDGVVTVDLAAHQLQAAINAMREADAKKAKAKGVEALDVDDLDD